MTERPNRASGYPAAAVIVARSDVFWAIGLRRELEPEGFPFVESASVAEAWQLLPEYPAGFLVVQGTRGNLPVLLEHLMWTRRDFPLVRVAVVGDRVVGDYRWSLCEFGAIAVVDSPRRLPAVAEVVRRHFARLPQPRLALREQIWASLPWPEAASGDAPP